MARLSTDKVEELIRLLKDTLQKLDDGGITLIFDEDGVRWYRDDPATD